MHVALNSRELPPTTIKSVNLLDDGLSYTRGEARLADELIAVEKVFSSLKNGDIIEYHLRASNGRHAEGKARINRIFVGGVQSRYGHRLLYAFELEPVP